MGIFLGGLTSLLYGIGDFLGGEGAKRAPAAAIVLWAGVVSFPLVSAIALINGGSASGTDLALGAAAGTAGALGLVFLFAGLGKGHAAAVAPAAGAFAGMLPVVVAVVTGERPSTLAWLGVGLAIPAIVLSSWVADPGDLPWGGVGFGVIAGVGFGGYAIIIDRTSATSELLPLISARAATIVVVLVVALLGMWKVTGFGQMPRGIVLGNGFLDVAGNITLLAGLRVGSLALVAVSSSLYPVVTVVMARVVNREHLRGRQVVGIVMTLVALAAIALG
ncbi:MAG: DMT family transporter [Acidobacteria bacterium]|nr:DMT family transporter [Acidobacteriota bacterium]TDI50952.1 MAG: DMT family transporter [Acidobacteriota bacterium]